MANHVLLCYKVLFSTGISICVRHFRTLNNIDDRIRATVESSPSLMVTPATNIRLYLRELFHLVRRVVLSGRYIFRGVD